MTQHTRVSEVKPDSIPVA